MVSAKIRENPASIVVAVSEIELLESSQLPQYLALAFTDLLLQLVRAV